MVNFDDSNTMMRNKKEIEEITILQRRYETINQIKKYTTRKYKNQNPELEIPELQSQLMAIYYELDSIIDKDLIKHKEQYQLTHQIKEDIESNEEEKIFKAWEYINKLLYRQKLTQVDSNKQIDWTDPEAVNNENEL